jgi:hypothetical protein
MSPQAATASRKGCVFHRMQNVGREVACGVRTFRQTNKIRWASRCHAMTMPPNSDAPSAKALCTLSV